MTYVLLNHVNTPSGPVAPGSTFSDDSEQIPALLLSGAIFGEVSIVGYEPIIRAEKMKRRGSPWEAIELYLLEETGKKAAIACKDRNVAKCISIKIPPNPPTSVPCSKVDPWDRATPTDYFIVMRGSRLPSGALIWAGDIITGELCEFAANEGLEVVSPDNIPSPTNAIAFANEVASAKRRGTRTWEQNEQAATRARLSHCVERCFLRDARCPPLSFSKTPCSAICFPYIGGTPKSSFLPYPFPR
jgi:hypothetical protein